MAALRNQSRPIERFVGVDASSSDASLEVLRANLPSNSALLVADEGSLGLSLEVAASQLPEARSDRDEWLWIIHDDSMPAPDALEQLTRTVEASESVSIAGCKLLDIDNPRHLVEVGLSVDRKAQRLTMIDIDEVDQGQYDGRSDYFAVSSAGMFIRREVFEQLGGFDPAIPGRGDDVDLCWRNRLAGHRVVVVPSAKMYHQVEVVDSLAGPREAKRSEVFQRLKFASPLELPFLWIGLLLGGIGHFLVALLAKDPGHGFSHLASVLRGLFSPGKLAASRRNVAQIREIPRRQVRKLMVSGAQVREYRRNVNTGRADGEVYGDGSGADAMVEPSGDNFSDFVRIARPPRTTAVLSLILALLLSGAASLVAWRSLLGSTALSGGALRPLSNSNQEIGANALSWWQNITTGLSAPPDNSDVLFWLFSLVTFNHANEASIYLFFAAMPLAALTAWWGIGAVSRSRAVRFFAALIWALLPSLVSALASGRVGSVLIHILLPLFFLAIIRAMNAHVAIEGAKPKNPKQQSVSAWTASASAALLLWVISAGSVFILPDRQHPDLRFGHLLGAPRTQPVVDPAACNRVESSAAVCRPGRSAAAVHRARCGARVLASCPMADAAGLPGILQRQRLAGGLGLPACRSVGLGCRTAGRGSNHFAGCFRDLEFFAQPQFQHAPELPPPAVGRSPVAGSGMGRRFCPVHLGLAHRGERLHRSVRLLCHVCIACSCRQRASCPAP